MSNPFFAKLPTNREAIVRKLETLDGDAFERATNGLPKCRRSIRKLMRMDGEDFAEAVGLVFDEELWTQMCAEGIWYDAWLRRVAV